MVGIADTRRTAPIAEPGVKQTVGKGERALLIAEVDRPRLASHAQPNWIELVEVPYHVARNVLKAQNIAKAVLQPGGKLRDSGILERFDEEVLPEVHRVDDVL